VITDPSHPNYARWGDETYAKVFGASVYAPYMQVRVALL
jgi:hypothetical protein